VVCDTVGAGEGSIPGGGGWDVRHPRSTLSPRGGAENGTGHRGGGGGGEVSRCPSPRTDGLGRGRGASRIPAGGVCGPPPLRVESGESAAKLGNAWERGQRGSEGGEGGTGAVGPEEGEDGAGGRGGEEDVEAPQGGQAKEDQRGGGGPPGGRRVRMVGVLRGRRGLGTTVASPFLRGLPA